MPFMISTLKESKNKLLTMSERCCTTSCNHTKEEHGESGCTCCECTKFTIC